PGAWIRGPGSTIRVRETRDLFETNQTSGCLQFIRIDGMPHPLVDALVNRCTHASQYLGGFVDSLERDVCINVAAPEKDRCAGQRSLIVARRARRTDQPSAEADDGRIAVGIAGSKLE